jgi:hypothetical protein
VDVAGGPLGYVPIALVWLGGRWGGRRYPQRVGPRPVSGRRSGFKTARRSVVGGVGVGGGAGMRRAGWRGPRALVPGEDPGGGCHGPVLGQEAGGALREIRRGWAQGRGSVTAIMACWPAGRMGQPDGSGSPGERRRSWMGQLRARPRPRGRAHGIGVYARGRERGCRLGAESFGWREWFGPGQACPSSRGGGGTGDREAPPRSCGAGWSGFAQARGRR